MELIALPKKDKIYSFEKNKGQNLWEIFPGSGTELKRVTDVVKNVKCKTAQTLYL